MVTLENFSQRLVPLSLRRGGTGVRFLVLFLGFSLSLFAEEQKSVAPDTLTVLQAQQVDSIEKHITVKQCCQADLASCVRKKPACALAGSLHGLIQWLVGKQTNPNMIAEEAGKRYESLTSTEKSKIDTTVFPIAGDPKAPVLISGYVTGTCPLCHYITRELYAAVSPGGALYGKARLMVKPLGATPGNLAMCAANELGRFWDFFIALSNVKLRADSAVVYHVADSIGIKQKVLSQLARDPKTLAMAQASTAEAGANGVTVAPTVFFNRVRYKSYKDPRWLIDAAEYLYEVKKK
jgi:protein-disulfide isomerase